MRWLSAICAILASVASIVWLTFRGDFASHPEIVRGDSNQRNVAAASVGIQSISELPATALGNVSSEVKHVGNRRCAEDKRLDGEDEKGQRR